MNPPKANPIIRTLLVPFGLLGRGLSEGYVVMVQRFVLRRRTAAATRRRGIASADYGSTQRRLLRVRYRV